MRHTSPRGRLHALPAPSGGRPFGQPCGQRRFGSCLALASPSNPCVFPIRDGLDVLRDARIRLTGLDGATRYNLLGGPSERFPVSLRPAFAALLLVSCAPPPPGIPGVPDCDDNSAPYIANLTMDSVCTIGPDAVDCLSTEGQTLLEDPLQAEEAEWGLMISFAWADPGVQDAGDETNMVGGMISGEVSLMPFSSLWLVDQTDPDLSSNSAWFPIDPAVSQDVIVLPAIVPEEIVHYRSPASVNFRVRDACDVESNNIDCTYLMGTGEWIDCVPPAPAPDE